MSVFSIHNIQNDFKSYKRLINLYVQNKDKRVENIDINLSGWFSANTCSMLGAILTEFQNDLNTVTVNAHDSEDILERNGFLAFFGHRKTKDTYHTAIPYQVLSVDDDRYFNNYVFREFISKPELPDMTVALKKRLTESIYEIFINAKMHSKTDKIFICGQFYPKKEKIEFMLSDTGIGMKNVVNDAFNVNISAVQAIKWAVQDGNTTKKGVSGGIGLSLLYEFIKLNKGKLQIISNDGFWQMNDGDISIRNFENEFPGTVINISVRTNDCNSYMLNNEIREDIF